MDENADIMRMLLGYLRSSNAIFKILPSNELNVIYASLVRVRLVLNQPLVEQGQVAEHAYFVEEGIISLRAPDDDGLPGIQVAMIGHEGIVGSLALLGKAASFASAVVQVPGAALRISLSALQESFEQCPVLREHCFLSIQGLTRQVMSTAASNASDTVSERCVRWLLMAQDRMGEDDLPVTHEVLSAMLGVRRSGVTTAIAALQEAGLIQTRRGRIRVLDRAGLKAVIAGRNGERRRNGGRASAVDGPVFGFAAG